MLKELTDWLLNRNNDYYDCGFWKNEGNGK